MLNDWDKSNAVNLMADTIPWAIVNNADSRKYLNQCGGFYEASLVIVKVLFYSFVYGAW